MRGNASPLQTDGLESSPRQPGGYILILRLATERVLSVGALGRAFFPAGIFAYVGSAKGPGGVRARVLRHARGKEEKRFHWHIDFLMAVCELTNVWWHLEQRSVECELADLLAEQGSRQPRGFGASDCRCRGHLIHFESERELEIASKALSLAGRLRLSDDG